LVNCSFFRCVGTIKGGGINSNGSIPSSSTSYSKRSSQKSILHKSVNEDPEPQNDPAYLEGVQNRNFDSFFYAELCIFHDCRFFFFFFFFFLLFFFITTKNYGDISKCCGGMLIGGLF
jgi:hypothetical protein